MQEHKINVQPRLGLFLFTLGGSFSGSALINVSAVIDFKSIYTMKLWCLIDAQWFQVGGRREFLPH